MSKFLIIHNNKYAQLQEEIIAFLWDNGHEVIVDSHYGDEEIFKQFNIIETCVITIGDHVGTFEHKEVVETNTSFWVCWKLHFSPSGVYSNAIPYPYRIFAWTALNVEMFRAFFHWSKKLNLFAK